MNRTPLEAFTMPSISKLTRVVNCAPSHVYPGDDRTTEYSEGGRTMHRFLRAALGPGGSREAALAEIPLDDPDREACEIVELDGLPTGGLFEVAIAIDPEAGAARILGTDLERGYAAAGCLPHEIPGSADYAVSRDGVVYVVDFKKGWWSGAARDSLQLGALALGFSLIWECSTARVAHVYLRGAVPKWDPANLSEMQLAGIRAQLAEVRQRLMSLRDAYRNGEHLRVHEGPWCKFCPAVLRCPNMVDTATHMVDEIVKLGGAAFTIETAAQAVGLLERVDFVAKRMWAAIEAIAAVHPIPLGDGRVMRLARGRGSERVREADKAVEALGRIYGDRVRAELAKALGITKEAIEGIARDHAKANDLPIGKTQEGMLDVLRAAGLMPKSVGEEKVRIVNEVIDAK